MLSLHAESSSANTLTGSDSKLVGDGDFQYVLKECKTHSEMKEPASSPLPVEKSFPDPTLSAKKLPKKRKFDPSELDELEKMNNSSVDSILTNVDDRTLFQSSSVNTGQLRNSLSTIDEVCQVTIFVFNQSYA